MTRALVAIATSVTLVMLAAARVEAQPQPEDPLPRWDVAGVLGWRGVRISGDENIYRTWDSRFVLHGSVGYYWTPNVKTEVEVGALLESEYQTYQQLTITGFPYPPFVHTEHRETGVPISARGIYQFGENQFFHPFVGAGVAFDRTRDEAVTPRQTFTAGARRPDGSWEHTFNVEQRARVETDNDARGLIIVGFKAYPNERGFMRTDLIWSVGSSNRRYVSWRIGAGVDF